MNIHTSMRLKTSLFTLLLPFAAIAQQEVIRVSDVFKVKK